jgi:cytochrome c556
MQTRNLTVVGAVLLVLAAVFLSLTAAAPPQNKPPADNGVISKTIRDEVNKMADAIGKGQPGDENADAFAAAHKDQFKQLMWIFQSPQPEGRGGFGVGRLSAAYQPNDIEGLIHKQAGPSPLKLDLKMWSTDLNRIADVTIAVADLTFRYPHPPQKVEGNKTAANWKDATERMKTAAHDLKKAVKAENQDDVRTAFKALSASCTHCHGLFPGEPVVQAKERPPAVPPKDPTILVSEDIRDAITKMADAVGKGEKIDKDARDLRNKRPHDLREIMWVFKPRDKDGKGGFGVGKSPTYVPDGIEGIIITYGNPRKKPMTAKEIMQARDDFLRLADVAIAVAEVTRQYTPKKPAQVKLANNWTKFADDVKQSAQDLKTAVKEAKPDATKTAFTKLYSACTNCHSVFRDDDNDVFVPQKIEQEVNKMAKALAQGKKIDKDADIYFDNHKADLKQTHWIFKPRDGNGWGGFGVGPKEGVYLPDGIEGFIIAQANPRKKPLTDDELNAAAADLLRLAHVTLALAEITGRYTPDDKGDPKTLKEWHDGVEGMKRGASDLKAAIKAKKPDAVKKSFATLYDSCIQCHKRGD